MTEFSLNMNGFVLNIIGSFLNMTGFVLNKTGFVLNTNEFVLNMTGFVQTITGFFLTMTGFVSSCFFLFLLFHVLLVPSCVFLFLPVSSHFFPFLPLSPHCIMQLNRTLACFRAQRDSIRSQTLHSKGTAYDITKYQTFLTKYGKVCPFKRTFVNSRGTAYHIL